MKIVYLKCWECKRALDVQATSMKELRKVARKKKWVQGFTYADEKGNVVIKGYPRLEDFCGKCHRKTIEQLDML